MSEALDPHEWLALRFALVAVAAIALTVAVGWQVERILDPPPTRLESTLRCLTVEKGFVAVAPAGDPLSATAGAGSLRATIEGNGVTVALASSIEQAVEIERRYHQLGGALPGRLERRDRVVYLFDGVASPTQQQALYDCQY